MTPEEILHNISHKVAQGIGLKGGLYEYVYHNSSSLSRKRSFFNDKSSCLLNCNKNTSSRINPVNSKLYNNARHFYLHNPAWYTCLCNCEHTQKFPSSSNGDKQIETGDELKKTEGPPVVLLMDDHYQRTISEAGLQNNKNALETHVCKCLNPSTLHDKRMQNLYANRQSKSITNKTININEGNKQNRTKIISNDPEYAMVSLYNVIYDISIPFRSVYCTRTTYERTVQ